MFFLYFPSKIPLVDTTTGCGCEKTGKEIIKAISIKQKLLSNIKFIIKGKVLITIEGKIYYLITFKGSGNRRRIPVSVQKK